MEQLLFKSGIEKLSSEYLGTLSVDYGDLNEQAEKQILDSYQSGLKKGLELMQEFDKWKAENEWFWNEHESAYIQLEYGDPTRPLTFSSKLSGSKSFSELFEIFIKETMK